ncbi:MAG TPA: transposase [Verrucomicrobiae bacterium]|nr:transposase [Verrucomicrobiae bacterium]
MWTPTTRQKHSRTVTRYQTDLTDTEWRVIAPHLPKPCAAGRPREWPMREIVNGIFYVMRAGCPWRMSGTQRSLKWQVKGWHLSREKSLVTRCSASGVKFLRHLKGAVCA